MAGTKAGALKARDTNITKYGPDFYKKIGSMSWLNPRDHNTGFALLAPEKRVELGRKGGKKNKGKKYGKKIVYLSPEEALKEIQAANAFQSEEDGSILSE